MIYLRQVCHIHFGSTVLTILFKKKYFICFVSFSSFSSFCNISFPFPIHYSLSNIEKMSVRKGSKPATPGSDDRIPRQSWENKTIRRNQGEVTLNIKGRTETKATKSPAIGGKEMLITGDESKAIKLTTTFLKEQGFLEGEIADDRYYHPVDGAIADKVEFLQGQSRAKKRCLDPQLQSGAWKSIEWTWTYVHQNPSCYRNQRHHEDVVSRWRNWLESGMKRNNCKCESKTKKWRSNIYMPIGQRNLLNNNGAPVRKAKRRSVFITSVG